MLSTLLELVGVALVIAAAYLVSLPLALLVAGAALVFIAQALDRPRQPKAPTS